MDKLSEFIKQPSGTYYGNLRPENSQYNNLYLGWAPAGQLYPPWNVELLALDPSYGNLQWTAISLANPRYCNLTTNYTALGTFYLTTTGDSPGTGAQMDQAGTAWTIFEWSPGRISIASPNNNLLQAVDINAAPSQIILGAWPEGSTSNPEPRTPGQIWIV
jgi:hypothetical protein